MQDSPCVLVAVQQSSPLPTGKLSLRSTPVLFMLPTVPGYVVADGMAYEAVIAAWGHRSHR